MWTLTWGHRWTWEAWVTGCCHTKPGFTARLLPFGQGALTAARPRRCLHFTHVPMCFTFDDCTGDCFLCRFESTNPPATSASWVRPPDPSFPPSSLSLCALTLPHTLEGVDKNSQELQEYTPWISFSKAHWTDRICRSGFMPCRNQLWFPCATLRIVINTLHCS